MHTHAHTMWGRLLTGRFALVRRCASSAKRASSSPLAALRKRTGLPLLKCKEALEVCNNEVDAAERWLQEKAVEEGWQKAEQLSGREAKQGYLGAVVLGKKAAVIELNCETDFVARTAQFQSLVAELTRSIAAAAHLKDSAFTETFRTNPTKLGPAGEHKSVSDAIVHTVGQLAENIVLSSGCLVEVEEGIVTSYVYNNVHQSQVPLDVIEMGVGTFVSLVHLRPCKDCTLPSSEIMKLGHRIGQHVVGTDPSSVSSEEEEGAASSPLLTQSFLFDASVTVGEMLKRSGVEVLGFTRHGLREEEKVVIDRTSALSVAFSSTSQQ